MFSAFGLVTTDMRVDESVTAALRSDLIDPKMVDRAIQRPASARRYSVWRRKGTTMLRSSSRRRSFAISDRVSGLTVPVPLTNDVVSPKDVDELRQFPL